MCGNVCEVFSTREAHMEPWYPGFFEVSHMGVKNLYDWPELISV